MFRLSFPEGTYALQPSRITAPELVSMARAAVNQYEAEVGSTEAARYIRAGDPLGAAEIMLATARRVLSSQVQRSIQADWDDPEFDISARLDVVVERGPGTGVKEIDRQIVGFQPGQLITYLGRAKAGKSTFLMVSAFYAWMGRTFTRDSEEAEDIEPRRVLFVTTEMPYEDIRDTLTAYGAHVNPGPFLASTKDYRPSEDDARAIRRFWRDDIKPYQGGSLKVVQPAGTYTIADLEAAASQFDPGIIYVDGFYFLYDPETKKFGSNWEAQDRLANQMKALAMKLRVPIVVSHQVREKQLDKKKGKGIDDGAMMGGSALRMASDMVLGFDKDDEGYVAINNTASRRVYFDQIRGSWDWDRFQFDVEEYSPEAGDGY